MRAVRDRLTSDLRDRHLPPGRIDDARIVLSELVANSLRHACALPDDTIQARWQLFDDVLVVAVTDGGSSQEPHVQHPTLLAVTGRGLGIVESLASRWWVQSDRSGTTVYAEIGLTE